MLYNVKVIPNSAKESVKVNGDIVEVRVTAPAHKHKANRAMLKILKKHFNAHVRLVKGAGCRIKIVETT